MRRILWAIGLHALLISQRTILALIGAYVVAATFAWCGIGILLAYHLLPPAIGWGRP